MLHLCGMFLSEQVDYSLAGKYLLLDLAQGCSVLQTLQRGELEVHLDGLGRQG